MKRDAAWSNPHATDPGVPSEAKPIWAAARKWVFLMKEVCIKLPKSEKNWWPLAIRRRVQEARGGWRSQPGPASRGA